MLHFPKYDILDYIVCNVNCYWIWKADNYQKQEVADYYCWIILWHLSYYYRLCYFIAISIVSNFRKSNVDKADGCKSKRYQPTKIIFRLTCLHDGQHRADAFISCITHSKHYWVVVLVEWLVAWARLVVVLLNFQYVKADYCNDHGNDNNPTINIAISKTL